MDFDYLQKCFYEVLRIEPPISATVPQNMSRDVQINGIVFSRHTPFHISITSLHHDPKQWRDPSKFVPERFDS